RRRQPTALAEVARVLDQSERAVLFEHVGPEGAALTGNVLASRKRFACAFGVAPDMLLPQVLRRLRTKPELVEVPRDQAPVQEVVFTGDEVDVTSLPAPVQHGKDGGPYISAAIDITVDPATKITNVGLRRLMVRGRRETGIDLIAASDLKTIYRACA